MIERYNYRGDPNIGFYATVTGSQSLYPPEFEKRNFFSSEGFETFIAQTRLVGLFTAGNSNGVLVPDNVTRHEREKLEEEGVRFRVIDSRNNALGNMVLANDKGALVSEKLRAHKDVIEDALDVPVEFGEVAGLSNVGVCATANDRGALLHREASEEEAEKVEEALQVDNVDIGTINLGSPYIGSGIVLDNDDFLVGEETSGPEIGRIDTTLQQD